MQQRIRRIPPALLVLLVLAACGGPRTTAEVGSGTAAAGDVPGTLRVYTTVTQDTVDAVLAGFAEVHPGADVEVFRAPTGEFNARVAAERRDGRIHADVFWLSDPLSMHQFHEAGLLRAWTPDNADAVPQHYRTDTSWGTRLLNLVIVHQPGLEPAPATWHDLTNESYAGNVALPDPGFAGSAFAALGYFALSPDFGVDYYAALADNGAVQVQAPGEVISGVAEGRFLAGMTLDNPARSAIEAGSPLEMVRPEPGAIAVYSPIAVLEQADEADLGEAFVEHVLSVDGQEAIASTGWQPVRADVEWPHPTSPSVSPDWPAVFGREDELLEQYRATFGG